MAEKLFDFVKNCFTKIERVTSTEYQPETTFMVTRFLSMNSRSFPTSCFINTLSNSLPSWAIGCLQYWLTPKIKPAPHIPYIKKEKENKGRKEIIQLLGNHFCCSPKHAEQYLAILESEDVNVYSIFGRKK